ncbi:MAG: acetylxylan esterase [Chloroflexi bacterium]|nr:acetylxylan esterase [Chloroflexota bacterium]
MPTEGIRRFWEQTRAALAEVEMNAIVEPVEQSDAFTMEGAIKSRTIHRVIMTSFEGRRIRAWYAVPAGEPPSRGWPAIMEVPGYGGIMPLPLHLVQYGYATLSLFPRGQGESLEEWQIESGTRLIYNVTDRYRYYYRGAYMDCLRGLDLLQSRKEVDKSRVGVWGSSQGGGLALATAALDHRVSAAVAGVPWLCNFPVAAEITARPYVELHDYLAEHPQDRAAALATLSFFDQVNLADAIVAPTLIASAIIDEVHPLRTVMPVFERIPAMKSIIVYPDLDHGYRADFTNHGKFWMDRYLR